MCVSDNRVSSGAMKESNAPRGNGRLAVSSALTKSFKSTGTGTWIKSVVLDPLNDDRPVNNGERIPGHEGPARRRSPWVAFFLPNDSQHKYENEGTLFPLVAHASRTLSPASSAISLAATPIRWMSAHIYKSLVDAVGCPHDTHTHTHVHLERISTSASPADFWIES